MRGDHHLDLVALVGAQSTFDGRQRHALTPGCLDHLDVQAVALAKVDPAVAEHPEAGGQNGVAGRQRVGHRRFPAAGAGRREQEDLAVFRAEDLLHACHGRTEQPTEGGRAVVHGGHVTRLADFLGDIGGPGDEDRILKGHGQSLSGSVVDMRAP
jgi:hypothetical protein